MKQETKDQNISAKQMILFDAMQNLKSSSGQIYFQVPLV